MNCLASSVKLWVKCIRTLLTSYTRANFLNMRADESASWLIRTPFPIVDHFVTIFPYYRRYKVSKNGNASPPFKILTDFFCTFQVKDSLIVDIENRRLIGYQACWW